VKLLKDSSPSSIELKQQKAYLESVFYRLDYLQRKNRPLYPELAEETQEILKVSELHRFSRKSFLAPKLLWWFAAFLGVIIWKFVVSLFAYFQSGENLLEVCVDSGLILLTAFGIAWCLRTLNSTEAQIDLYYKLIEKTFKNLQTSKNEEAK
jgi:hypothetical protein